MQPPPGKANASNETVAGGGIDGSNLPSQNSQAVTIKVVNSTITGNSTVGNTKTSVGGGMNLTSVGTTDQLTIVNSTVANNVSDSGGVSRISPIQSSSSVMTKNTILASNIGGNCAGTVTDGGRNISFPPTDASCANTFAQGDPVLGALGNNGGLTKTMALGAGSAAIDTADYAVCVNPPPDAAGAQDQRGLPRAQAEVAGDLKCDIGAFEVQPVVAEAASQTPGLPAAGAITSPVLDARRLPPWAPAVPAAVTAAAVVGALRLRRKPVEATPQD